MAIARSLKNYLKAQSVQYPVDRHAHMESSMHTAAAAHVPGDRLAKSVLVTDEEGCLLVVVPSSHRVQLGELVRKLGLATEDELRMSLGGANSAGQRRTAADQKRDSIGVW